MQWERGRTKRRENRRKRRHQIETKTPWLCQFILSLNAKWKTFWFSNIVCAFFSVGAASSLVSFRDLRLLFCRMRQMNMRRTLDVRAVMTLKIVGRNFNWLNVESVKQTNDDYMQNGINYLLLLIFSTFSHSRHRRCSKVRSATQTTWKYNRFDLSRLTLAGLIDNVAIVSDAIVLIDNLRK